MITYNKERGAWNFKDITQDEKDVLLEMAEQVWAQAMAAAVAREMMKQAAAQEDPDRYDGPGEDPDDKPVHDSPTGEAETNVYPFKPGCH